MRVEETVAASMDQAVRSASAQTPELRPVFQEFFERHLGWDAMRDDYAAIYAARFTEAELREMTAFFETPTGRKLAEATPELALEAMALGERVVTDNRAELIGMIEEARAQ